jgi:hypothetical protein
MTNVADYSIKLVQWIAVACLVCGLLTACEAPELLELDDYTNQAKQLGWILQTEPQFQQSMPKPLKIIFLSGCGLLVEGWHQRWPLCCGRRLRCLSP